MSGKVRVFPEVEIVEFVGAFFGSNQRVIDTYVLARHALAV